MKQQTGKDESKVSLKDLCKPISAKVMPRSAMYSCGGIELDDNRALKSQRRSGRLPRKIVK